jgi:hypothetical protein
MTHSAPSWPLTYVAPAVRTMQYGSKQGDDSAGTRSGIGC